MTCLALVLWFVVAFRLSRVTWLRQPPPNEVLLAVYRGVQG